MKTFMFRGRKHEKVGRSNIVFPKKLGPTGWDLARESLLADFVQEASRELGTLWFAEN